MSDCLSEEVLIEEGYRTRGERLWPTPTAMDGCRSGKELDPESWLEAQERHASRGVRKQFHLGIAVEFQEAKSPESSIHTSDDSSSKSSPCLKKPRLNPRFVEWLMGFPDNWTEVVEPQD